MKPVIALVGRPNVGKSTLFNRLTKSRDAIVADFAGLTRDRHYGSGRLGKHEYIVVDTGGFEPTAESGIYMEMAKQTRQAVAEADVVLFVVDARAGLSAQDHDIARYLRKLGKPCVLVANKAEGMKDGSQLSDFYELGLGAVQAVSAAHGQGVRDVLELALEPAEIAARIVRCHFAITTGSSWSLELACVGVPQLLVVQSEAHWPTAQRLEDEGCATCLGWHENVSAATIRQAIHNLLTDPLERKSMARCGRKLIDGRGPDRFVTALELTLNGQRRQPKIALAA